MSTTKPAYINRLKFADALVNGGYVQTRCNLGRWEDSRAPVCWYGAALRFFGVSSCDVSPYAGVNELLDISLNDGDRMITLNDDGKTFPELATVLLELPFASEEENKDYYNEGGT